MSTRENPLTPQGREQNPHARLVQRTEGIVHFKDSQGHPFEARDLEVTLRVGETADQAQRKLLAATLLAVPDKTRAADVLGVSRRSLYDRLRRLGLPPEPGANCWLAPGFDAIQMVMDLEREVRGRGGRIPQECLYAEPLPAKRWLDYEQDPAYLHVYRDLPLEQAAAAIGPLCTAPVVVLSLGPGGGVREVHLVQDLLQRGLPVRRLYLLDLSQPLLARAVPHAEATLPQVRVTGIWGNMYHLPRYDAILPYEDRSVVQLVTMLGGTFGNLRNEIEFVRDGLGPLAPGDLLLFDACLRPPIEAADPRLSRPLPSAFVDWITTPLRQHGEAEVEQVRAERTEETTVVRGSYAVDFVAHMRGGAEFRLGTLRRYDEPQLVASLRRVGWHHRRSLLFGGDYPRALLLFQKGQAEGDVQGRTDSTPGHGGVEVKEGDHVR